ncbi:MAG: lysozyme [Nanoarchaeota archaeon]
MLLKFKDFIFDQIINESLNESLITEKIDINKILMSINNIKDKKMYIRILIEKFNNTTSRFVKKNIAIILILLYFGNAVITNSKYSYLFKPKIEKAADKLSNKDNIEKTDIYEVADDIKIDKKNNFPAIDINTVKTSDDGIELIKGHEKLVLTAYALGDGMITIGYGHANPIESSPYKVGDKITKSEAYRLFKNDLKRKEDGVRRILLEWEKDGIDVKITQSMFDAMVSMAFNMGLGGLRRSEFIQYVKNQDYEVASELIKSTRINPRFPGLKIRRSDESELFLKDYNLT